MSEVFFGFEKLAYWRVRFVYDFAVDFISISLEGVCITGFFEGNLLCAILAIKEDSRDLGSGIWGSRIWESAI
ncbi:hypothetical protein N7453_001524 [Penicillium expansum]|nr:hypothetical protein N7453_001524 [Penicillium expansum]